MKVIFKKILLLLLKYKPFKDFLTRQIGGALPCVNRDNVVKAVFNYPSFINNGFLHIERAINILKERSVPTSVILDVGAAAGETCIIFSKSFPQARIVGFEPLEGNFRRLRDNVGPYPNIHVEQCALGATNTKSLINRMSRITASSLFMSHVGSSLNGNKYFEIEEKEEIIIRVLDDFSIEGFIAIIKIDVQGYELEVLKGAVASLDRTYLVLLEMQNHDIYVGAPKYHQLDQFLRDAGFELFDLIPSVREKGQIMEFDAIYFNKQLLK
jgi:FkbM family methyltransferase